MCADVSRLTQDQVHLAFVQQHFLPKAPRLISPGPSDIPTLHRRPADRLPGPAILSRDEHPRFASRAPYSLRLRNTFVPSGARPAVAIRTRSFMPLLRYHQTSPCACIHGGASSMYFGSSGSAKHPRLRLAASPNLASRLCNFSTVYASVTILTASSNSPPDNHLAFLQVPTGD